MGGYMNVCFFFVYLGIYGGLLVFGFIVCLYDCRLVLNKIMDLFVWFCLFGGRMFV